MLNNTKFVAIILKIETALFPPDTLAKKLPFFIHSNQAFLHAYYHTIYAGSGLRMPSVKERSAVKAGA